jgi:hypothetical protein
LASAWQPDAVVKLAQALVVTQTPEGQEAPAGQAVTSVQVQTCPGSPVAALLPAAPWQSAEVA